ncbi:hypothetical protein FVE85_4745 [Porphyridium purpureum]|uniref:DUF1995 domain-containing protein n=1 Tax=Porphyridium purpureum TaxID=35688 RepID=A0A5J4YQK6_PORPP|nr:hypothetical protein FVE85_4745 [Porphyridium purpureum]|eukprot:POR4859..scf236_6
MAAAVGFVVGMGAAAAKTRARLAAASSAGAAGVRGAAARRLARLSQAPPRQLPRWHARAASSVPRRAARRSGSATASLGMAKAGATASIAVAASGRRRRRSSPPASGSGTASLAASAGDARATRRKLRSDPIACESESDSRMATAASGVQKPTKSRSRAPLKAKPEPEPSLGGAPLDHASVVGVASSAAAPRITRRSVTRNKPGRPSFASMYMAPPAVASASRTSAWSRLQRQQERQELRLQELQKQAERDLLLDKQLSQQRKALKTGARQAGKAASDVKPSASESKARVSRSLYVGCSRFPEDWQTACLQAAQSCLAALVDEKLEQGLDKSRISLEMRHERMYKIARCGSLSDNFESILELVVALCSEIKRTTSKLRIIKIFLNTDEDVMEAEQCRSRVIPPEFRSSIRLASLDGGSFEDDDDWAILACPRNTDGNPIRIEKVEYVHYENWRRGRPVIMLNPDLVVLTLYGLREERRPSFLSDYREAYVLDQFAYFKNELAGALLYAYPRNWEVYIRHVGRGDHNYRLAKQYEEKPSSLMIQSDLSWRADALVRQPALPSNQFAASDPDTEWIG